ncbi:hypothetical protein DC429_13915 [Arthrobacter sp. TPD3018]|nr:hypothetical protein DC429_13915 [Arthrobacter sp. TPD3018]
MMSGPTLPFVIPANAGIHGHDIVQGIAQPLTTTQPWIPAFAGMTRVGGAASRVFSASPRLRANQNSEGRKAIHV